MTGQGQTWHKFLSFTTFAYNIFHTPNLRNYSPYELVFGRRQKILLNIETDPDIKVSGTYKDYHTLLTKRLDYLQNMLQNFKMKHLALLNKDMEVDWQKLVLQEKIYSVKEKSSCFTEGQGIFSVQ